jgi:hypothetical protein
MREDSPRIRIDARPLQLLGQPCRAFHRQRGFLFGDSAWRCASSAWRSAIWG